MSHIVNNVVELVFDPAQKAPEQYIEEINVLSKQLAALELVVICAQDIVAAWPETTMRTLSNMTKRVDTLRQALAEVTK